MNRPDAPRAIHELRAGDIGFTKIKGKVGFLVSIGQAVIGDPCRYTHTFLCLGDGWIIEAMPGGARLRKLTAWDWHPNDGGAAFARLNMTDATREVIKREGPKYAGTPYSFADYLALALKARRRPYVPVGDTIMGVVTRPAVAQRSSGPTWLDRYVTDSGHMICSQLADHVLAVSGVHLFNDGRLHQDVTPGDLFYWCAENATMIFPHSNGDLGGTVHLPGENFSS